MTQIEGLTMFATEGLLNEIEQKDEFKRRSIDDPKNLITEDEVLIITKGTAVLRDDSVFTSDVHATQTFQAGDAFWIAETISKRPLESRFSIHDPLEVIVIKGDLFRQEINRSSFLTIEILRNTITRIFQKERKINAVFEDRFLKQYRDDFQKCSFGKGELIYEHGDPPKGLYFINKGSVLLATEKYATKAYLYETDFFGERSIIASENRGTNAFAEEDTSLLLLDSSIVQRELSSESPLVQLSVLQVLRQLELMNKLRFSHLEGVPPIVQDEGLDD